MDQDTERELEKHTYFLDRGKGELSGHGKKGTRKEHSSHLLEKAEIGTGQDMERKQASRGHSQTGEGRERDWSGHGKKASQQGGTYFLERAERGTGQDSEGKKANKGHSLPGESRGQHWSQYGKKVRQQGVLTSTAWGVENKKSGYMAQRSKHRLT